MTLMDYEDKLKNQRLYPYTDYLVNLNNHDYKITLSPDTDALTPELHTLLFSWNERYNVGDYRDERADLFLYRYVKDTLNAPDCTLTPDRVATLLEQADNADTLPEWYLILSQLPHVTVTRLCIYEHSGASIYPAPAKTDSFDTRCTVLALYTHVPDKSPDDNTTAAADEVRTYCAYFNGEVYALTLHEPVTVVHTRLYIDGHTITTTDTTYEPCAAVYDLYDVPANLYDAVTFLAQYSDTPVRITAPLRTPATLSTPTTTK